MSEVQLSGGIRHLFHDRLGRPIDLREWGNLFESRPYRFLGIDRVGDIRVITIWDGVDTELCGPPLIFGTVIFGGIYGQMEVRHATEIAAQDGHEEIVRLVREGASPPEIVEALKRKALSNGSNQ